MAKQLSHSGLAIYENPNALSGGLPLGFSVLRDEDQVRGI
jgi:hypothetical protein